MVLRYPREVQSGSDFVTITAHKYTTNASGTSSGALESVVIYMPNSTPTVANGQNWQDQKFEGPIGKIKRDLGAVIAGEATNGMEDANSAYDSGEGMAALGNSMSKIGDAARQALVGAGAGIAGVSANQMLAYTRGQIFNPNVELLYEGPQMRSFGMNFNFIPKDAQEAVSVREIVRFFKVHSSPLNLGTLYEIPHVFHVAYGGLASNFMNQFKRSALTSISVQYNAGLDMHATFSNGCPIRTDIQLSFMEVDVVTRKDHQTGAGF